ncbi:MAG: hypothetical protein KGH55_02090 [Nanoarchaeota archaeon]|nr:hypothetical protein [Nanoarchaeota archaeon]
MRKVILYLAFVLSLIFLASFAHAQIVYNSALNGVYSVGDTIDASNVTYSGSVTNMQVSLQCTNTTAPLGLEYLNGMLYVPSFMLSSSDLGTCSINFYSGNQLQGSTSSFQVSDYINVNLSSPVNEFKPGDYISLSGNAIKANGQPASGVAVISITSGNNSVYQNSIPVNNGLFSSNFSLSSSLPAGQYVVTASVYETDSSGAQLNKGADGIGISVDQVPTTLNLISGNSGQDIIPGDSFSVESVLYDQSGKEIDAPVSFVVKTSKGNIIDREQRNTGDSFTIPVSYNDAPDTWTIYASSENLSTQLGFNVLPNPAISATMINRTVVVTNTGNVPYNSSLFVTLGNRSFSFNVSLDVGQSQKYLLSAPDGKYYVAVSSNGNSLFSGDIALTGNAVAVQKSVFGFISLIQYPLIIAVVVVVLVFLIFFFFRKWHRKGFRKKVNLNKTFTMRDGIIISDGNDVYGKDKMISTRNSAELSLSIHGDKQTASIICVDFKNFEEIKSGRNGVSETMNRMKSVAEDSRAVLYENGGYFFFIFSQLKTKREDNEMTAIKIAKQIERILQDHNRLLKQKIDFGISVSYGMIIARDAGRNGIKFTSLGNSLSAAKRLAFVSRGEVVLGKNIKDRVASEVKTDAHSERDLEFYTVSEIRDRERGQKFAAEFMKRLEKEEKDRRDRDSSF